MNQSRYTFSILDGITGFLAGICFGWAYGIYKIFDRKGTYYFPRPEYGAIKWAIPRFFETVFLTPVRWAVSSALGKLKHNIYVMFNLNMPEVYFDIKKSPEQFKKLDLEGVLNFARIGFWEHPKNAKRYAAVCDDVRSELERVNGRHKPPTFDLITGNQFKSSLEMLYGVTELEVKTKEDALKHVLAQIHCLMINTGFCVKYLKFLNDEFERYYQEKHAVKFPTLDANSYEITAVSDLFCPIPKDNYQGLKKSHALQEFLILLFKKHGLAKNAYKWVGYIPAPVANKMIVNGDFFTENRIGSTLFHGKIAHMLQQAIFLYAIESGEIQTHGLTLPEILKGFIDVKHHSTKDNLWMRIRDVRYYYASIFADPHRLGSFVMCEGRKHGMTALADYMTDTFCKGFNKTLRVYRENSPDKQLSREQFIEYSNDMCLRLINDTEFVMSAALGAVPKNNVVMVGGVANSYAVVPKHYKPNVMFKPKTYQEENSASPQLRMRIS